MLEKLRDASKGWFAVLLLVILIGSFGMWGVQDMLNLNPTPRIADVGGEHITPEEFQREYSRFIAQMSRSTGKEIDARQAKLDGLDREALDRLIRKRAIIRKASDLGLRITPEQIIEALRPIKGLVTSDGKLNAAMMAELARQNDMSPQDFMALITTDLTRDQMMRPVVDGIELPPGMAAALNRFRLERRTIDYVVLDEKHAGSVGAPDDAAIRKFYEANADTRYAVPELRTVAYVTVSRADVDAQISVTEADIAKAYEASRSTYETLEKRVLEQIRFKNELDARAARSKLDAGTSFEDVAKAQGLGAADIKLGELSKGDKSVPAEAFETAVGVVSAPLKGPFGWVITRTLSVTPGSLKTLDEVRGEIGKYLGDTKAKDLLFDLTGKLEDDIGAGATLEEAAAKLKLQVKKVTISAEGTDAGGAKVEGLPGGDFLVQVFAADIGSDPELVQAGEAEYFEFRVDRISPRARKPLDSIKAQVVADWLADANDRKLRDLASRMIARGTKGETLAALAAENGLTVATTPPLPRFAPNAALGDAALKAASDSMEGQFFSGPDATGKGIVVGRVAALTYEDEPAGSPLRRMYTQRVGEAFVGDFAEQIETGATREYGATIDEQRFQAFHNNE